MDRKYLDILYDTNFKLLDDYANLNEVEELTSEKYLDSFLLESLSGDLAYKNGKKDAVDAVIISRERHLAQKDWNEEKNPVHKEKLRLLKNRLSDDKQSKLVSLVKNAEKTDDRISVDIEDQDNMKSITADFERKTHMSLHVMRDMAHPLLKINREGRQKSTGYGENSKFITDMTGKDIRELTKEKYASDRARLGLREEVLFEKLETEIPVSKLKAVLSIPLSRLANFSSAEIKKELIEKDADPKDVDKYKIPKEDQNLSINSMKNLIINKGSKEDKEKIKDKIDAIEKAVDKADEKGIPYKLSFGTVKGIYNLYKKCQKRAALKEDIEVSLLDTILDESEFADDLANIYGKYFQDGQPEDIAKITIISKSAEPKGPHHISIEQAIKDKSEVEDVLNMVKDIVYGFINKKTGERIDNRVFIHNCNNLSDIYSVNRDPEVTLKNKLGICQDQSILIRHLINKLHPDCKCKIFALMTGRYGHAVPCYQNKDGKWEYIENAWDLERGIHGKFDNEDELKKYLDAIYHKHHDKDTGGAPVTVMDYEQYLNLSESYNWWEEI